MCCVITILLFFGPRVALFFLWLFDPARINLAFNSFVLPCLGFIFLPWTTLAYALTWQPGGVQGLFSLILIGVALIADLATLFGGAYGNRRQIRGYVSRS